MDLPSFASLCELRLDIRPDVDMGLFTTFGAGGRALALIDVYDRRALSEVTAWCAENNLTWRILGAGSNVLVASALFEGIFIRLKGDFREMDSILSACDSDSQQMFRVGAGHSLSRLAVLCMKRSLSGMEWAAGIPGTVGGALFMNAGAYGSCMGEHVKNITCLDQRGRLHQLSGEDVAFHYRKTVFPENIVGPSPVILGTTIVLQQGEKRQIRRLSMQHIEKRKQNLPGGAGSAGSFFKNPKGEYAGRLIEDAGLKGRRIGNARYPPDMPMS